jgi:hypothetical protein
LKTILQRNMRRNVFREKELQSSSVDGNYSRLDDECSDDDSISVDKTESDNVSDELALNNIPVVNRVQLASHHYTKCSRHPCVIKTCKELRNYLEIDSFYSELNEFLIRHHSIRLTDETIDTCPVKVFHSIRMMTEDLGTGKPVEQRIRCTIKSPWFKSHGVRNDWVWTRTDTRGEYGVFHGNLPARLACLIEITVENTVIPVAFVERICAVNVGIPNQYSKLARAEKPVTGTGYKVISTDYIVSAAHLIPDEPLNSPELQRSWVVNSHIDLETWNTIYW